MMRHVFVALFGALMLSGCLMIAGPEGTEVMVVPPLPAIVELDFEPFFFHRGYHYHYRDDNHWSYSRSKDGPWNDLPRGHYPKEVKWKNKKRGKGPK